MNASAIVLMIILATAGCSGNAPTTTGQPGAEVPELTTPTREVPENVSEDPEPGPQGTSVELPGLPIGGSEIEFEAPSTRCADVNLTGEPLPAGVRVRITAFDVPLGFAVSSDRCGSAAPCLAADLTGDGCQVALTWNGERPSDDDTAALAVRTAAARCADQAACDRAAAIVAGASQQAIRIRLPPPDDGSTGTTDTPSETTPGTTGTTEESDGAGEDSGLTEGEPQ